MEKANNAGSMLLWESDTIYDDSICIGMILEFENFKIES